jgi:hypothetical protein
MHQFCLEGHPIEPRATPFEFHTLSETCQHHNLWLFLCEIELNHYYAIIFCLFHHAFVMSLEMTSNGIARESGFHSKVVTIVKMHWVYRSNICQDSSIMEWWSALCVASQTCPLHLSMLLQQFNNAFKIMCCQNVDSIIDMMLWWQYNRIINYHNV